MHNNIMAAGLRDRPPMLATGRYAQWQSHFLRYIDTRPNGDALRKCILESPYTPSTVIIPAIPATNDSPEVTERTTVETILNMSPENKEHYQSEKEAIHLLLTGIRDEIYSTVDACKTTHDMWIAIERLQQGESLNIQYAKTNLFWEFGKFTSHDGESMESYYSRFYKMMNEMIRNNLTVAMTSHASTKYKGKEIAKPITPPSESASEEDSDPEQAQRDKDMQKNLALIAKYFKKIYKPTNNDLRTSSNSRNKNVDTSLRYKNDNQNGQFRNQRTVTVDWARETVGNHVVQQTRIHCFNCKEFGHFAKECRKPKRVKDYSYHKEKMLLYKQAEKGVPLQAVQADWLKDMDEEIDEQELEAHYSYMAKIQEVPTADSETDTEPLEQVQYDVEYNVFANERQHFEQPESINNTCVVEKVNSNVIPNSPDMCNDAIQTDPNAEECDDERVVLANLIANLKLDVDENKKFQKQLKKANTSLTHELKECKSILAETSRTLDESNSTRDSCLIALQSKQTELETYKTLIDHIVDYDKLESQSEKPCLYEIPYDIFDLANILASDKEETLALKKETRSKLNKDLVRPYDYTKQNSLYENFKPVELVDQAWDKYSHDHFRVPTAHDTEILFKTCLMPLALKTQNDSFKFVHELKQEMHADLKDVKSLEKEIIELESNKAEFSNMYDILLQECVSNDVMCSYLHSLSDLDAHTKLQCLYLLIRSI
ncbi:retrovirus-related pol polyprotein from transposon TNT 1-94 [Tanacetum coccineum]